MPIPVHSTRSGSLLFSSSNATPPSVFAVSFMALARTMADSIPPVVFEAPHVAFVCEATLLAIVRPSNQFALKSKKQ